MFFCKFLNIFSKYCNNSNSALFNIPFCSFCILTKALLLWRDLCTIFFFAYDPHDSALRLSFTITQRYLSHQGFFLLKTKFQWNRGGVAQSVKAQSSNCKVADSMPTRWIVMDELMLWTYFPLDCQRLASFKTSWYNVVFVLGKTLYTKT